MSEICRKDALARNLNAMVNYFPDDYNFFPRTWYLPTEYVFFRLINLYYLYNKIAYISVIQNYKPTPINVKIQHTF